MRALFSSSKRDKHALSLVSMGKYEISRFIGRGISLVNCRF